MCLAVTAAAAAAGAGAPQLHFQAGGVRLLPVVGCQAGGLGLLLGDQATHLDGLEVLPPPHTAAAATAQQQWAAGGVLESTRPQDIKLKF